MRMKSKNAAAYNKKGSPRAKITYKKVVPQIAASINGIIHITKMVTLCKFLELTYELGTLRFHASVIGKFEMMKLFFFDGLY